MLQKNRGEKKILYEVRKKKQKKNLRVVELWDKWRVRLSFVINLNFKKIRDRFSLFLLQLCQNKKLLNFCLFFNVNFL